MKVPEPIKFSRSEGGVWETWYPLEQNGAAHAILFDDGSVFDLVNGWRKWKYCPHCGARDWNHE